MSQDKIRLVKTKKESVSEYNEISLIQKYRVQGVTELNGISCNQKYKVQGVTK